jgi:hypothetical protein
VWGNGRIPPLILNLGFSCVWRSTSGPDRLYNEGKNSGCLLSRGFDGPQNRSDRFGEERIVCFLLELNHTFANAQAVVQFLDFKLSPCCECCMLSSG